ncbi:MAG: serine/threonine-protein kinase, partial [Planctomycetota bacterium]
KLGQGGMGAVYRGKHLRLGIDVALKVMAQPSAMAPDQAEEFVKRFIREAQTAAQIDHPNLVRVLDVNTEHGVYFLVMQLVDGESAGDRLKRTGRIGERGAVEIILGAAEGLAEAHKKGIVHRDVKPDNILLDKEGRVRVADLGLAKAFSAEETNEPSMITMTQQAIGTPYYMSPEQFASARSVGPAADVWSLGVTLYQLLTGRLPWADSNVFALAVQIQGEPPPDPRAGRQDLSDSICKIIDRALQKEPQNRYTDCGQMARALRDHLQLSGAGGEVTLADTDAGVTKLSLVTMTPPPARTLTLIAAAVLDRRDAAAPRHPDSGAIPTPATGRVISGRTPATIPPPLVVDRRWLVPLLVGGGVVLVAIIVAALLLPPYLRRAREERDRREKAATARREDEEKTRRLITSARSFRDAGLHQKAEESLVEVLSISPGNGEATTLLAQVRADIERLKSDAERTTEYKKWMEDAFRLKLAGKLEEAATAYDRAANYAGAGTKEAATAREDGIACLHEHYKLQAREAEKRGELELAAQCYAKALARKDDPEVRRLMTALKAKLNAKRVEELKREIAARYRASMQDAGRSAGLKGALTDAERLENRRFASAASEQREKEAKLLLAKLKRSSPKEAAEKARAALARFAGTSVFKELEKLAFPVETGDR